MCPHSERRRAAPQLSYGFLLGTVQRTSGVQDRLLGVVEELRDVLQVFGRTL